METLSFNNSFDSGAIELTHISHSHVMFHSQADSLVGDYPGAGGDWALGDRAGHALLAHSRPGGGAARHAPQQRHHTILIYKQKSHLGTQRDLEKVRAGRALSFKLW